MVFSELAAATLIAMCGLKNSYRIILKGERIVRRRINVQAPALEGYHTFPRIFVRRIFRAGLIIANRWQGRAKNAAQIAADTRMRAKQASSVVAKRAEDVRSVAKDVRKRAQKANEELRTKVQERMSPKSNNNDSGSSRKFSSSSSSSGSIRSDQHHQQNSKRGCVGLGQISERRASSSSSSRPCVHTRY